MTPTITIKETMHNAWNLVRGIRWPIWAPVLTAFVLLIPLIIIVNILAVHLFGISHEKPSIFFLMLTYLLEYIVLTPFLLGAYMVTIKRSRQQTVSASTGFQYFKYWIPAAIALIIVNLITTIPPMLILMLFVYLLTQFINLKAVLMAVMAIVFVLYFLILLALYTFFILTLPLIAEKGLSPIQAIIESFKKIESQWNRIFTLVLICSFYLIAGSIPLYLGMILAKTYNMHLLLVIGFLLSVALWIWILPVVFMIHGWIYHRLMDGSVNEQENSGTTR